MALVKDPPPKKKLTLDRLVHEAESITKKGGQTRYNSLKSTLFTSDVIVALLRGSMSAPMRPTLIPLAAPLSTIARVTGPDPGAKSQTWAS